MIFFLSFHASLEDSRYFIGLTKPRVIFVNAEMAETMAQAAKEENLTVELITFSDASGYRSFSEIIERQDDAAINDFRCTPISNLDEVALLACSSGSTGMCKAVMMSHCALINNMLHDDSSMKEEGTVVMWFSSFRWISGTLLPIRAIYFGQTWIVCPSYEEELTCKLIEKYNVRATVFRAT
jgi:acyl-coenzyme A synthetase/AMP-(fatty) acid ligase